MKKFEEFELDVTNEVYSAKSIGTCLSASSIKYTLKCTNKCSSGCVNPTKKCNTVNTCRTMR